MIGMGRIYLGALRLVISVPGARTLKDRRQTVRSVIDRVSARFSVSVHEVDGAVDAGSATLVATTAGASHSEVRDVLSRVRDVVAGHPVAVLVHAAVDLRRWDPFEVGSSGTRDGQEE